MRFPQNSACAKVLCFVAFFLQLFPLSANELLLAGWHDFSSSSQAHRFLNSAKDSVGDVRDVTGVLYGGDGARTTWGSTDGFYGPSEFESSNTPDGVMSIRVDRDTIHFTLRNEGTRNIFLSKIVFDFASVNGNSPRNMTVYYESGGLTDPDETVLARWEGILNGLGTVSDYEDQELDLSILQDQILSPGEQVMFRFQVDTANVNNQALGLDNIAILGGYADFAVITYNIRGGKGSNDSSYNAANLRAFRDDFLQGEDVICLQEVDYLDGEWDGNGTGNKESIKSIFSDYPYTFQTINSTTDFVLPWQTRHRTSVAILSKHPFAEIDAHLVQTDPQGDLWERNAQHVRIELEGQSINIFNFHNTFNFGDNDFASEKLGLERFEDYVESRLAVTNVLEGERLIMLGDFNLFQEDVTEILPCTDHHFNGRDHICSVLNHSNEGHYRTVAADLSDHPAVWATIDLLAPNPSPPVWASEPASSDTGVIRMEAAPVSDPYGVEYYFTNTTIADGTHDSGWQSSASYEDYGLEEGVTYTYTVMARDKSPNANLSAPSVEGSAVSTIAYVLPPYEEGFENGMGAWVQVRDDDYNWTLQTGGTPSPASGPNGASEGSYYLYSEGHDAPNSFNTTSVEAHFDFSGSSAPTIQFDYHMYGDFIDFLALDVYDGSEWHSDVWLQDSPQQTGSDDPWSTASVDLSTYAGLSKVKLRFRTANLRWFSADPAIDNVRVSERQTILYSQWQASVFAASSIETDASLVGNPDQDDYNNQAEWIFGLDPMVADSPIKEMSVDSEEMSVSFTRRKLDDFRVFAQWSSDLTSQSWNTVNLLEEVINDDGEIETVIATIPVDLETKFIRVIAIEN